MGESEKPKGVIYSQEEIDDISLRALEVDEIREAVRKVKRKEAGKIDAIKTVRGLLQTHFGDEISQLPEPKRIEKPPSPKGVLVRPGIGTTPAQNDFIIAKNVVDMLMEE